MTLADLVTLSPLIVLAATAVLLMLVIAFDRSHVNTLVLTLVGLAVAFVLLFFASLPAERQVTTLLVLDGYALFYIGLLIAGAFVVAALAYDYLERHPGNHEEFYVLLVLATLGSSVLAASTHFASFFLGLEILSVSLYGLVAYLRTSEQDIEAGIKYLVLAASSAAFLLFGMALVYAESGTMEFARMASLRTAPGNLENALLLTGLGMLIIGIGFKLAVVPFHMWTPDVYEGAPAPVTGFIATVSKGGMFALLLRYYTLVDVHAFNSLFVVFTVIAIATMLIGNLLALLQDNVKRILAYSSIAHFGYALVAFLASGEYAVTAVTVYLVTYFATTLAAFGVIGVLSGPEGDADDLEDYRGLSYRHPALAGIFTVALLSLASIPMTAGFIGKFYVFRAGVGSALWLLVLILVAGSAIGLYYYLRIVVTMFMPRTEDEAEPALAPSVPLAAGMVLAALTAVVLWLGLYPTPLINVIETTVAGLF